MSIRASCAHSAEECGGCATERRHRQTLIALQDIRDRLPFHGPAKGATLDGLHRKAFGYGIDNDLTEEQCKRIELLENLAVICARYLRSLSPQESLRLAHEIEAKLDKLDPAWRTR